jgi:hypothetical protein
MATAPSRLVSPLYCTAYIWLGAYRSGTEAVSLEGVSRDGLALRIREIIWGKQANIKLPLRAVPRVVVSGVADTLSTSRPFQDRRSRRWMVSLFAPRVNLLAEVAGLLYR